MENGLTMRKFTVRVMVVPPVIETLLCGTKTHYETRIIDGYTKKDAKKRAGIA